MSMFDCTHCGDRHHVNDFCATGPMSAEPVAPTTRETADHAELARTLEALAVEASASRNIDGAESMMVSVQTIYDLIVNRNALLSEIAALRGELKSVEINHDIWVEIAEERQNHAAQAERQRDELRGEAVKGFAFIHTMLMTPSVPRQSAGEVANTFLDRIANQGADQ